MHTARCTAGLSAFAFIPALAPPLHLTRIPSFCPRAPSQSITEGFQLVLNGTTSEICYLLDLFQPQSEAETEDEDTVCPLDIPHYDECGMQRTFMLGNLKRVMDFWGLKQHAERRGVWGSAMFSGEKFQVVRKKGRRAQATQAGVYFLIHFNHRLTYYSE